MSVELNNLHTDDVMIRSELKYIIGGKAVIVNCRVFGGKTGPFPVGRVLHEVRPVGIVRFRVEPDLEPTRKFGLVGNTTEVYAFIPSILLITLVGFPRLGVGYSTVTAPECI